jgi:outer membrane protein assembly factor BamB
VEGRIGDTGRHLHALDARTGKPRWKAPVAARASGILCATPDQLLIQDRDGELACFTHQGQRQWGQKIGDVKHVPVVTATMIVAVAGEHPGYLLALDRPTGRELWRMPLEAAPTTGPMVHKDRIYLGTHRGLEARALVDGIAVAAWKMEGGSVSADFAQLGQDFVYVNDEGELVVVARKTGAVLAKVPGAEPKMPPLVSREVALFLGKDGLMRLALQGATAVVPVSHANTVGLLGSPCGPGPLLAAGSLVQGKTGPLKAEPWAAAADLGPLTSPLVLCDGMVFVGTALHGLARVGKN